MYCKSFDIGETRRIADTTFLWNYVNGKRPNVIHLSDVSRRKNIRNIG